MALEVVVVDTSADTDALSATDLETIPEDGLLVIFCASTVATATLTASLPMINFTRAILLPLRAGGVPNINEDNPIVSVIVQAGERPTINLGGTTGTIFTIAMFKTAAEIAAGL